MSFKEIIEREVLPLVTKPARYMGNEVNSVRKDWASIPVKIALAYPDLYEIGMSHLGIKILYDIVNSRDDALCERVFAPWKDMETLMRQRGLPLFSLETKTPLKEFDIVGFSLQYELTYTNVINMLALAGIKPFREERKLSDPLILGGGPCALNPEPMASFFDAFLIGEGEEAIGEIIEAYNLWKQKGLGKEHLLASLNQMEGIYVPSLSSPSVKVKRRWIKNLDTSPHPTRPLVPFIDIVHDRLVVEIMRGCPQGCRFCQAGIIYRPWRLRSPSVIFHLAQEGMRNTGYRELSLSSLSSTDHPQIGRLYTILKEGLGRTNISLPSLRIDSFYDRLAKRIDGGQKAGFTFAPEAATERLQAVINKSFEEAHLMESLKAVFRAGADTVKFYFLLALPTETQEDLLAIVKLLERGSTLARAMKGKRGKINVNLSPFIPKAHTPFQWERMAKEEEIREKYQTIITRCSKKNIKLKWREPEMCLIEAGLARGDRSMGPIIYRAWQRGATFDGWSAEFKASFWQELFDRQEELDLFFQKREGKVDIPLPWDHIDIGIPKEFLSHERSLALQGGQSPACEPWACSRCGVC